MSSTASPSLGGRDVGSLIALVIVNFIPAALVPFIANRFKIVSDSEAILLGVLLWILITCYEILFHTSRLTGTRTKELALWDAQTSFDSTLSQMRKSYRRLLGDRRGDDDLFQRFFEDRATELERLIYAAAERGELSLDRDHVISLDAILTGFSGGKDDIFRAVHFFRDNEFFFRWGRQYFSRIHGLVQAKKIRQVKRLMVYETEAELRDPLSQRLMAFHTPNAGFSYKAMSMQDFRSLVRDRKLDCPGDFGVYGNRYVYRARLNQIGNIEGDWLRRPDVVASFISLFEACWNSQLAGQRGVTTMSQLSLDDLFASQSAQ